MRTRRVIASCLGALLAATLALTPVAANTGGGGAAAQSSDGVKGPIVGPKVTPKLSKPARDLPAATLADFMKDGSPLAGDTAVRTNGNTGQADPVAQLGAESDERALVTLGPPIVNVPGQGGSNPTDTNGDVGPNDFVQMINSTFRIFDKQGAPRGPAAAINTLWTSVNPADPSECATQNRGDPIVLYDNEADRWLLSQFAQTRFICIAISQTPDPTGAYFLYQFGVDRFPDYFKIGAWPDGYYVSANFNGPNEALAAVMDRANMLNGNPAAIIEFAAPTLDNNFDVLIPSDMDGMTPPPPGTPNYMYRQRDADIIAGGGVDRLEVWEFRTNWSNPALTTFTGPIDIPTAPFDSDTCGYGFTQCPQQPGTAQRLDPIQIGTMFRFAYRNFGSHEALVGNFTVDADGNDGVGIRWFVLERSGGGAWAIANEGTYAPQPGGAQPFIHRWMGSAAMDRFGNLALGYTASSSQNIFPSARYTGRAADDPLGLLPQPERTIQAGLANTGIGGNRWGDYFAMTIDPVDDCTFWYTGDATAANGSRQSRIASFRFSDCATDLQISKTVTPAHPNAGEEIVYTITVTNAGGIDAQNVVVTDELPAEVTYLANTDSCTGVAVGATGTLTCPLGTIPAGQSRSFQIKVRINADLGGATAITNTATVTGDPGDSDTTNNTIALTHLVNELADVRVTKLCKPDTEPAPAGTNGVCSIFVTNDGPSAARAVNLTDTHVSNGTFSLPNATTSQGACAIAHPTVTCALGTIQPGATVRVDVTVSSTANVDVNDVARATSATPDPNLANNEATAGLSFDASADLSITKTGPANVTAGTNLIYTLTVDNAGPSTAEGVVVTDELPAGVTFVSASPSVGSVNHVAGTVTWSLGNVAVADPPRTLQITVFVDPSATGQLVNSASVTSQTADPNLANNLATFTTTIDVSGSLTLTKTDSPDPVIAGNNLSYTITVGNTGPSTATDVVVTDTLPAGTSFVSAVAGPGITCAEIQIGVVRCEVGSLLPGQSATIVLTVQVAASVPDGTILVNNVVATSPADPDGAAASASTTVITRADLWMEKTGQAIAGNPSGAIIFRLIVHNEAGQAPDDTPTSGAGGPSDAQNVVVTDVLPLDNKKMTVQFLSPSCTYAKPAHTVTCTTATLPAGTSVVYEIQVQIQGSVGTITNTASVTSSTVDPTPGNNSDTVNVVHQGGTGKGKKPN